MTTMPGEVDEAVITRNTFLCTNHYQQYRAVDRLMIDSGTIRKLGVRPSHEWLVGKLRAQLASSDRYDRARAWVDRNQEFFVQRGWETWTNERKIAERVYDVMAVSICCTVPEALWLAWWDEFYEMLRSSSSPFHRIAALKIKQARDVGP